MTQPFPPVDLSISPVREGGKRYLGGHSFELGELRPACDDYTVVRYEPAVPKCATCPRYSPPQYDDKYGWCLIADEHWGVPPDGSGYCHRHPEAKKQP